MVDAANIMKRNSVLHSCLISTIACYIKRLRAHGALDAGVLPAPPLPLLPRASTTDNLVAAATRAASASSAAA